jgi:hypothetical protein
MNNPEKLATLGTQNTGRTQIKKHNTVPRLKSSLQKLDGHHHDLVDRFKIAISQMTMDLYVYCFLSSITANTFTRHDCIYELHSGCLIWSRNCVPFTSIWVPPVFGGLRGISYTFFNSWTKVIIHSDIEYI